MPKPIINIFMVLCILTMTSTVFAQTRPRAQRVQHSKVIAITCAPKVFKQERLNIYKYGKLAQSVIPRSSANFTEAKRKKADIYIKRIHRSLALALKCFKPVTFGRTRAIKTRITQMQNLTVQTPPPVAWLNDLNEQNRNRAQGSYGLIVNNLAILIQRAKKLTKEGNIKQIK